MEAQERGREHLGSANAGPSGEKVIRGSIERGCLLPTSLGIMPGLTPQAWNFLPTENDRGTHRT